LHLSATGKTLEEIDILFARSQEVRDRLEKREDNRRQSVTAPDEYGAGRLLSTFSEKGVQQRHVERV